MEFWDSYMNLKELSLK